MGNTMSPTTLLWDTVNVISVGSPLEGSALTWMWCVVGTLTSCLCLQVPV